MDYGLRVRGRVRTGPNLIQAYCQLVSYDEISQVENEVIKYKAVFASIRCNPLSIRVEASLGIVKCHGLRRSIEIKLHIFRSARR